MRRLVLRRLRTDWRLMLSVFLGILVATLLMSAAPVYLDALERQSIEGAVDTALERDGESYFTITVWDDFAPLEADEARRVDSEHSQALAESVGALSVGVDRYLRTSFYPIILPRDPSEGEEAADAAEEAEEEEPQPPMAEGFVQSFTRLDDHVEFVEGRAATDARLRGVRGPMVEAVMSARTAAEFGDLRPGDVIVVAPSRDAPARLSARVVGLIEALDANDPYWQRRADEFLFPQIPNDTGEVTAQSPPALGVFVDEAALIAAGCAAFPGGFVDSTWHSAIDARLLRSLSKDEMRARMESLREELAVRLPGAFAYSGIDVMLARFGRQSFLSSVPLLLLLATLGVATLYFLAMIVSYLAPSRESDVALFRSRGASGWRMTRLYLAEGTVLVLVAAAVAPFLAMLAVWLAGLLPHFEHITGGGTLPARVGWQPFAAAALAGAMCLAIFVIPGALGARAGLASQRASAARPPTEPLIQRLYIDVGLLIIGGALFWELQARGELVTGGLFGERSVNEALLLAPALFLVAVGLLFFRAFPLLARYLSGESLALVHVLAWATLPALGAATALEHVRAGDPAGWTPEAVALASFGLAYWLGGRVSGWRARAAWMAIQAAAIAAFAYARPPDPEGSRVIFGATLALIAVLPSHLAFHLLAELARRSPAWVSLTLWRMARSPLRYSWLALLLTLSAGIGVLATTVGATLDRSYEERARYAVGADIRIADLASHLGRRDGRVQETFGSVDGVESVTIAHRGDGGVGAGEIGSRFEYLAVDTGSFDAWHRADFSEIPLSELIALLKPPEPSRTLELPPDARRIRVWVKPDSYYPLIFLWMTLRDANGRVDTVSLGALGEAAWTLMDARIPEELTPPIELVGIHLNEPGYGATGTAGAALFDDVEVLTNDFIAKPLEGFEGAMDWVALPTDALSADVVAKLSGGGRGGTSAALFEFGKETNRGLRGFYRSASGGYVPAVASRSFSDATGARVGNGLLVRLEGVITPIAVVGIAEHFATMDPARGGFLTFDAQTLFSYLDMLNTVSETPVNELFLTVEEGAGRDALRDVSRLVWAQGDASGVDDMLAAQAVDPLISAGWRTMVYVALGVVLFISALGCVVYMLAFSERALAETGALRSLGLSRAQTVALTLLENMIIAIVGLALGAWAGFQMSRMTVAAVAVTDSGGRALPPFILTTDWLLLAPLLGAVAAAFAAVLLAFGARSLRVDLRRLSRMEN